MCGFAGIVDFDSRAIDAQELDVMAETIAHRGPDERGMLIQGACGLAHRRLSIVDLQGSQQPMSAAGSDVTLAYNGELYNYRDLRDVLAGGGVHCQSQGDTEVLLRWVAQKWSDGLAALDGMFAFAAWDRSNQRLLLARDPMGEKPLYYSMPRPGMLIFGSEAKAVLAHPSVDGEIDLDSLRQAMRFRTVYGDRTLYCGVRQVPAGSFLEFDREGWRIRPYFDLIARVNAARDSLEGMSDQSLIRHGRELLESAIGERLMADVPLGVFLSGGLDSSLIAAVTKHLSPEHQVRTFSVGFEGDVHSETGFARTVADAIASIHTEIKVGAQVFATQMETLSHHRDGPVSEPADVAVAALSRAAKQHVKVVLSGEGADEVFAGYPKYTLARTPAAARWALKRLGPERAARLAASMGMDHRRAMVAARALCGEDEVERLTHWFSYFSRTDLARLLPGLSWRDSEWRATSGQQSDALERASQLGPIGRMQAVDCLTWLVGNMLERGDRMTMSHGLEMRPPFLDKQLVEFGLALPDRMKVRRRQTKWIVRQWGAAELPAAIHRRPKWGFRVPLAQWFRGELRSMLFDRLNRRGGLCATYGDQAAIGELLSRHDRGQLDANLTLWALLSAEIWYQGRISRQRAFELKKELAPSAAALSALPV